MPETTTISGVEILRVGTYQGISGGKQSYAVADLDEMVAANAAIEATGETSIRVSLRGGASASIPLGRATVGHNDLDDQGRIVREAPVVGRLTNLRRKGDTLLADIADVPAKLATILAAAYPQRSVEGLRLRIGALQVGGRRFRQAITGLALLGESLPAVRGLADLPRVLAAADAEAFEVDMALQLADDPVAILDEVLSALDVWAEQAIPLVAGKAGAKAIRTRVWSLKQDIRRIAGVMIHNRSDDSMGDKDKDKPAGDAIQNAGPADPATAMAVIGEILGMPDADPTAIVAKIRELSGKGGEGAPAEGDDTMLQDAKPKDGKGAVTQNASGAESAEVVALRGQVTELLTWKATQETTAIVQQAEGLVDKSIAAGKFAPAQRETLVALAKHDRDAFVKLAESQPRTIPLGEVGTVGRPDAATLEGSEAEVAAMVQHGYGHDEAVEAIRMLKHVEKGVPYSPKTPAPTAPDKEK